MIRGWTVELKLKKRRRRKRIHTVKLIEFLCARFFSFYLKTNNKSHTQLFYSCKKVGGLFFMFGFVWVCWFAQCWYLSAWINSNIWKNAIGCWAFVVAFYYKKIHLIATGQHRFVYFMCCLGAECNRFNFVVCVLVSRTANRLYRGK